MQRKTYVSMLACAAGLTFGMTAIAQSDRGMQPPRSGDGLSQAQSVRAYTFSNCDALKGMKVASTDGTKIGDVENVIFDRLSGHIEALAVDLGPISKTVSIPYGEFGWATASADDKRLTIRMTEEQLKALPAFDRDRMDTFAPAWHKHPGAGMGTADPFYSTSRSDVAASGTIERIDVIEMPNGEDYTVVTISDTASGTRRVALGPSWYTRGGTYVPFRGAQLSVKGYEFQRDGQPMVVATEIRDAKGRSTIYRDTEGKANWMRDTTADAGYRGRYMLLSTLDGRDVQAQGESCGSIDDVIIEQTSGQIAFLSIDPNENFLGIADTKRLVPFSLAVIPVDGAAQLDASKEMVVASIETPDNLNTLAASDRLSAAYRAFGVEVPRFRSSYRNPANQPAGDDMSLNTGAWDRIGSTIGQLDGNSVVRISGNVESIETRTLGEGLGQVRIVRITSDNKPYEVIVGPPAYLAKQKAMIGKGEKADFTIVPIRLDAREYWIARTYQTKDGNVTLWTLDKPAWNTR